LSLCIVQLLGSDIAVVALCQYTVFSILNLLDNLRTINLDWVGCSTDMADGIADIMHDTRTGLAWTWQGSDRLTLLVVLELLPH